VEPAGVGVTKLRTAGYIEGTYDIPLRTLVKRVNEIPSDQVVLLDCDFPRRSTHALGLLHRVAYDRVRHLRGGYAGYRKYLEAHPERVPRHSPPSRKNDSDEGEEDEDRGYFWDGTLEDPRLRRSPLRSREGHACNPVDDSPLTPLAWVA